MPGNSRRPGRASPPGRPSRGGNSVRRLQWHWYYPGSSWQMELARAVSASACVPGLFEPLRIDDAYEAATRLQLIDGGVHDNQGTVALLAARSEQRADRQRRGRSIAARTSASTRARGISELRGTRHGHPMERVRLANHADLAAGVRRTGARLMFLHMKTAWMPTSSDQTFSGLERFTPHAALAAGRAQGFSKSRGGTAHRSRRILR